ncbi:MAG: hypothetical protein H9Q65_02510 [Spiroplasma ixodetis]|nr:hypothetical protein [Spiroplasma ixodetis]MBP1526981.1 hypothetical protein [Spiroplasma ixodetis]MBP1528110.1 hypothetical protein [Spiroplasma ixodetis]
MGPIYLLNKKGQRRAVHFHFTAWGMKNEPNINPPSWNWNYEIDNKVGIEMTRLFRNLCIFVLQSTS